MTTQKLLSVLMRLLGDLELSLSQAPLLLLMVVPSMLTTLLVNMKLPFTDQAHHQFFKQGNAPAVSVLSISPMALFMHLLPVSSMLLHNQSMVTEDTRSL